MGRGNMLRLAFIVLLAALALAAVLVREFEVPVLGQRGHGNTTLGMSLGLDLRGGIRVVYEADLEQIGNETTEAAIDGVIDIISQRVNAYGVSEPVILKMGENRISVELPGIRDMEAALNLIGQTAQLDFREVLNDTQGNPAIGEVAFILGDLTLSQEERNRLAQDLHSRLDEFREIDTFGGDAKIHALVFDTQVPLATLEQELDTLGYGDTTVELLSKPPYWDPERYLKEKDDRLWVPAIATSSKGEQVHLTGKYLKRNTRVVMRQDTNEPQVAFEFDSEGADLFYEITGRLFVVKDSAQNKPLGIFLDNKLVSSPTVQARLSNDGVITGVSLDEARELSILLNAGALPVSLGHWERGKFFSGPAIEDEVDPTLGADSIRKSLLAAGVGLVLVLAFMVLYYRLPGVLASVALLIYGVLVLAAFKLIPVTLTLAGMAAFILSIGMAVDANVLIFERLKEELRAGRTLGGAIEAGFNRAWTAIRDSNISTLITCGILYWLGSSFAEPRVMGFALILGIGVALSMFTAIVVTRTFLRSLVGTRLASRLSWFGAQRFEQTSHSKEQG